MVLYYIFCTLAWNFCIKLMPHQLTVILGLMSSTAIFWKLMSGRPVATPVGGRDRRTRPKNKAAFLKALSMNLAAMVAAQGLLVACRSHSCPKTIFLKERRVILAQWLLLKLNISEHSR